MVDGYGKKNEKYGWLDGQKNNENKPNRWMVGWIKKEKNRWMVGWLKIYEKKWMVGWIIKIYEKNMDGWMDKKN